jgi:hypothetical protein
MDDPGQVRDGDRQLTRERTALIVVGMLAALSGIAEGLCATFRSSSMCFSPESSGSSSCAAVGHPSVTTAIGLGGIASLVVASVSVVLAAAVLHQRHRRKPIV